MSTNGGSRKRGLNRAIRDAAFAELRRQLAYKLPAERLIVADRWFPSSKTCSQCGVENQDLTLRHRTWTCACGAVHDRDINAAINLAAWGERDLAGAETQVGDRDWPGPSETNRSHARREDTTPPTTGRGFAETGSRRPTVGSDLDGSGQEPAA